MESKKLQGRPKALKTPPADLTLTISPIGYIHSGMINKFDAPHQPDPQAGSRAVVELLPNRDFHKALEDLAGFDRIWLIFWFHRNNTWRPKVLPPRGAETKRGVFATRAPYRPNPIGISAVDLIEIDGRKITIGSCDLVDGTPILDIKPYIPAVDAFPKSKIGWLGEVEETFSLPPKFKVKLSKRAAAQADWLKDCGINFLDRAVTLLNRDPAPNKTRRIKKIGENAFRMGCAEWRIFFSVTGNEVEIDYILPGYPLSRLQSPGHEVIPNRDCQVEFFNKWPKAAK